MTDNIVACVFTKNKCHAHGVYPDYVIIGNFLEVLITCGVGLKLHVLCGGGLELHHFTQVCRKRQLKGGLECKLMFMFCVGTMLMLCTTNEWKKKRQEKRICNRRLRQTMRIKIYRT